MTARLRHQVRIMLDDKIALGPGKATLLEAIGRHGSISAAAREMGMSYTRAWALENGNTDIAELLERRVPSVLKVAPAPAAPQKSGGTLRVLIE